MVFLLTSHTRPTYAQCMEIPQKTPHHILHLGSVTSKQACSPPPKGVSVRLEIRALSDPEGVVVGSRVTFEFGPCWYPGEVRQVVVERTAGGHRQVRVDFDDGDNQKCTLLPG